MISHASWGSMKVQRHVAPELILPTFLVAVGRGHVSVNSEILFSIISLIGQRGADLHCAVWDLIMDIWQTTVELGQSVRRSTAFPNPECACAGARNFACVCVCVIANVGFGGMAGEGGVWFGGRKLAF